MTLLSPRSSGSAVDGSLAARAPIGLDEVTRTAELQRRVDHKYLVDADSLVVLLDRMGPEWQVLEVDGHRQTDYLTTYYDSTDLALFHAHLQGRRRRAKVRTRHYGDDPAGVLELKAKGTGGRTTKHRWTTSEGITGLDPSSDARLRRTAQEEHGLELPVELRPSLTTRFRRATLVDVEHHERVTVDTHLSAWSGGRGWCFRTDVAIVETKSDRWAGAGRRMLTRLGHRPVPVSKYGVGVARLHGRRANPWIPALRALGGEACRRSG